MADSIDADYLSRLKSTPDKKFRTTPQKEKYGDRFIPSRSGSNLEAIFPLLDLNPSISSSPVESGSKEDVLATYGILLKSELLGLECSPSPHERFASGERYENSSDTSNSESGTPGKAVRNLFRFQTPATPPKPLGSSAFSLSPVGNISDPSLFHSSAKKPTRRISKVPYKVLDAPSLQDDFYLNLVHWSSQNVLAVGLGSCVYLWSACTSKVTKLCDLGSCDETVTSVAWTDRGSHLAVGTTNGEVQIWDSVKCKKLRTMAGHDGRIGTLAWNGHVLSSGSRDRSILHRDVRTPEQYFMKLCAHKQEVCGLKWSFDGQQLASGGNDNKLLIWSLQSPQPLARFHEHQAAVKAIAWSPHAPGLLASGGGTADRCIRFWNTTNFTALNALDTGSQVCNLVWSKNVNEIASTHGYSQNQIIVWRYPSMSKVVTLTGHTMRVLYLSMSPDGQSIVTGAGDETLRFW
eukprot:CAMPEP_0184656362 /NCGR_PEP_ID=MMETSP0308-20130426/16447_1 /TAXON_ID=38269 /ORGANISM="Gloeochaete witrockiana, Strain SAG 46.84" /LENGTH=462 /DNA_ID=CAMNT_0027093457 /DNA_START=94 /DNA_END=1479 /DNA_ORIENTATION=-